MLTCSRNSGNDEFEILHNGLYQLTRRTTIESKLQRYPLGGICNPVQRFLWLGSMASNEPNPSLEHIDLMGSSHLPDGRYDSMFLEILRVYFLCVPIRLVAIRGRNLRHRVLSIGLHLVSRLTYLLALSFKFCQLLCRGHLNQIITLSDHIDTQTAKILGVNAPDICLVLQLFVWHKLAETFKAK